MKVMDKPNEAAPSRSALPFRETPEWDHVQFFLPYKQEGFSCS